MSVSTKAHHPHEKDVRMGLGLYHLPWPKATISARRYFVQWIELTYTAGRQLEEIFQSNFLKTMTVPLMQTLST